jgi:hypothetical protein
LRLPLLSTITNTKQVRKAIMILIATWLKNQDSATESPSLIYWANGSVATHEDYIQHFDHTHAVIKNPDGSVQQLFFPDLSGATFYDTVERVWKVRPQGETFRLFVEDPFADDHDIRADMSMCPIAYSPRIDRTKLTQTSH